MGIRWESKTQIWEFSGLLYRKKEINPILGNYKKNPNVKSQPWVLKYQSWEFIGTYKIKKYQSVKIIKNSQTKNPVSGINIEISWNLRGIFNPNVGHNTSLIWEFCHSHKIYNKNIHAWLFRSYCYIMGTGTY